MSTDARNQPPATPGGSQGLSPPATPNQQGISGDDHTGGMKRKRPPNESPPENEAAAKLVRPDAPDETMTLADAMTCSICMCEWTNSGVHRVVSLECGHLFGRSCIEQWLTPAERGIVKKCPTCGAKGKLKDLRNIYPIAVVAVDSDQVERLKHQVAYERGMREQKERELEQARMSLSMIRAERDRYESELRELRVRQKQHQQPSIPAARHGPIIPSTDTTLSQPHPGNSQDWTPSQRRMRSHFSQLALSLTTGPDSHTILLYSLAATATQLPTNPLQIHSKPIKHLAISPADLNSPYSAHPHLLTAGLDSRACLLKETRVVTEFHLPSPAWSCAFDQTDGFKVWVGAADCGVYGYDLRMPARWWVRVGVDEVLGVRGPGVHSVVHVAEGGLGGMVVAATMKGAVAWTGLGNAPASSAYTGGAPTPTPTGARIAYPQALNGRQCFALEHVHAPLGVAPSLAYAFRHGSSPLCVLSSTYAAAECLWTWPAHPPAYSTSPATLMTRFAAWQWSAEEPVVMAVPNEALNKVDVIVETNV
ncbi:hypothetical protein BCR44DRAFT_1504796 [Catenaria anguillulae PL171]|uniref:RING-type domain-containing protein n=1 Tax=Catenaria anguillulae PL171 TaxID=765915 RepID=A0A1Y2H7A5_9FUNG|nr:hypothetical protein BCR44DRAFT_1504796 [Catenaria anguillulae PL171]